MMNWSTLLAGDLGFVVSRYLDFEDIVELTNACNQLYSSVVRKRCFQEYYTKFHPELTIKYGCRIITLAGQKSLHELSASEVSVNIKYLTIHNDSDDDNIKMVASLNEICSAFPNLELLEFVDVRITLDCPMEHSKLKELHFSGCEPICWRFNLALLPLSLALCDMNFTGGFCVFDPPDEAQTTMPFEVLRITGCSLSECRLPTMPFLRELVLHPREEDGFAIEEVVPTANQCPQLKTLEISTSMQCSLDFLEHTRIESFRFVTHDEEFSTMSSWYFPDTLKYLELAGNIVIDTEYDPDLGFGLQQLEKLVVRSGVLLDATFVEAMGNLKHLELDSQLYDSMETMCKSICETAIGLETMHLKNVVVKPTTLSNLVNLKNLKLVYERKSIYGDDHDLPPPKILSLDALPATMESLSLNYVSLEGQRQLPMVKTLELRYVENASMLLLLCPNISNLTIGIHMNIDCGDTLFPLVKSISTESRIQLDNFPNCQVLTVGTITSFPAKEETLEAIEFGSFENMNTSRLKVLRVMVASLDFGTAHFPLLTKMVLLMTQLPHIPSISQFPSLKFCSLLFTEPPKNLKTSRVEWEKAVYRCYFNKHM
jgi:hypothetical protein